MEIICCKKRSEPSELRGVPTENLLPYSEDSFKICFYANFISFIVAYVLPLVIKNSSIDWIWDGLGSIIGLGAFTYLIAKELGDLKRSLLIALLLQALTFLFALAVAAVLVVIGIGAIVVSS